MIFSFIFTYLVLFYTTSNAQQIYKFDESQYDKIVLVHASGRIDVKNTDIPDTTILKTLNSVSSKDCSSEYEIKNRVLRITTEKKIFVLKSECTQSIELALSQDIELEVSLGVGEINFKGIFKDLDADLGSGNLSVQGKVSKLDLDVGTGSISVSGLDGYGKITLMSGDLDIKYNETPKIKLNQLFVSKATGNTTIQIPKGSKAETKLRTLLGQVTNLVKPSNKAPYYFSVQTNIGDILMNTY